MCYGIVKIHFINHSFNIYNIQQPTRIEGTDIYNIQYIYTHTHTQTNMALSIKSRLTEKDVDLHKEEIIIEIDHHHQMTNEGKRNEEQTLK